MAALLLFSACASSGRRSSSGDGIHNPPSQTDVADNTASQVIESLSSTYYAAESEPAYKLIQSGMISRLIGHWTAEDIGDDIVNPQWNIESFARYQVRDHNLQSAAGDDALFYCTFSADNGKYGYAVLKYEAGSDGGGLGNAGAAETPYPYDLKANGEKIADALAQTAIDLSSATAARGRLVDTDQDRSDEVIFFIDGGGNTYVCYLSTLEITAFGSSK
jgi:hypothetical protein